MTVRATPHTPKAPRAGTLCGGSPPYTDFVENYLAQWPVPQLGPVVFDLVGQVAAGVPLGRVAIDFGVTVFEVELLCLHHGVPFARPRPKGALAPAPVRSFISRSLPPGDQ